MSEEEGGTLPRRGDLKCRGHQQTGSLEQRRGVQGVGRDGEREAATRWAGKRRKREREAHLLRAAAVRLASVLVSLVARG